MRDHRQLPLGYIEPRVKRAQKLFLQYMEALEDLRGLNDRDATITEARRALTHLASSQERIINNLT
jgi:hypothetical protein